MNLKNFYCKKARRPRKKAAGIGRNNIDESARVVKKKIRPHHKNMAGPQFLTLLKTGELARAAKLQIVLLLMSRCPASVRCICPSCFGTTRPPVIMSLKASSAFMSRWMTSFSRATM